PLTAPVAGRWQALAAPASRGPTRAAREGPDQWSGPRSFPDPALRASAARICAPAIPLVHSSRARSAGLTTEEVTVTTVGIVGWRGMVGSVLLERMRAEGDFEHFEPVFFSTSQAGELGPDVGQGKKPLRDATDTKALAEMDAIISCQGGDYTTSVHGDLRGSGWKGYWIDAASTLRMADDSVIVLDPVNRRRIDEAIAAGQRDFIGGNCTVSLMLMAIAPLFERGWVEWINAATYQAASGAGARNMRELVRQMAVLGAAPAAADPSASILELDRQVIDLMR